MRVCKAPVGRAPPHFNYTIFPPSMSLVACVYVGLNEYVFGCQADLAGLMSRSAARIDLRQRVELYG